MDSLGKAIGKPLDSDRSIALYNFFDSLPVPVLVVDHTAKPNPEIPAELTREYGTVYKRHYARSAIQVDLQGSEQGHIGVILRHQKSNFGRLVPEIPLSLEFIEEDGVLLEVRLQYGGQAVQANAELFGRRGEVVRFLSENGEATPQRDWGSDRDSAGQHISPTRATGERGHDRSCSRRLSQAVQVAGEFITLSPPIKADKVINCESGDSADATPAEPPNLPESQPASAHLRSGNCPNLPECIPYDPRSETNAEWLARAEQVIDQYAPSFHERVELTWDRLDDWLQQASQPHDPLGLEPHELEALRVLLAFAEARGFPSLTLQEYGYTIQAGQEGWLNALPDIAGTPAVALATRLLSDTAGSPVVPAHRRTNGDAGLTPSQLSLMEG